MKTFLILCATVIFSIFLSAQVSRDDSLFVILEKLDSTFFERGFNQCDMEYLEQHIADDLRFFHDQAGIQNREQFFENTKKNLCSNWSQKPIRKVVPERLTVFPLYHNGRLYGAIQSGVHEFYIREYGKEDRHTSTAKFTSVWIKENELWKLTEVLSYDHH